MSGARLTNETHIARPWRIHELAGDFRLEDVWALPTPGGPDDFPLLVAGFAAGDAGMSPSRLARALWATRWKLGELLGWDEEYEGAVATKRQTIRDRLPADLAAGPRGPEFATLPFIPLYLLDDEFAAEVANRTVHGIMHLGWVPDGGGGYRGEMAVYVKPNGLLGNAYMAAIKPFRYTVVYPPMLRQIARTWEAGKAELAAR
ncbi:MAG TPA: DUF2867 domain-containing protein [Solirubrobacterales bacterium]|nr:DUF2867 domain-containing protein [Solirubrobacterales bacterium]